MKDVRTLAASHRSSFVHAALAAFVVACASAPEREPRESCCAAPPAVSDSARADVPVALAPAQPIADARAETGATPAGPAALEVPLIEAAYGDRAAADGGAFLARAPDVALRDQRGRRVRFQELTGGRLVVMNFLFTTCTTICPPLAANFARLQELVAGRDDVLLISVSVDPLHDTPERLASFADKFGAKPGWTFLTGENEDVQALRKALGVFTPRKEDHTPVVLIGDVANGRWRRVDGLAAPEVLAAIIDEMRPRASAPPSSPAQNYFTDVELVDQTGTKRRLYSDLIRGKVVIVDSFFAACTGVCPVLASNLRAIQDLAGDRLGRDVHILSVSVDPSNDTAERLASYAEANGAREGWYFLTGSDEEVRFALAKLGFAVESREQHSNVILVGNDRTGLWKKAFGLAKPDEIARIVESVLNDKGP